MMKTNQTRLGYLLIVFLVIEILIARCPAQEPRHQSVATSGTVSLEFQQNLAQIMAIQDANSVPVTRDRVSPRQLVKDVARIRKASGRNAFTVIYEGYEQDFESVAATPPPFDKGIVTGAVVSTRKVNYSKALPVANLSEEQAKNVITANTDYEYQDSEIGGASLVLKELAESPDWFLNMKIAGSFAELPEDITFDQARSILIKEFGMEEGAMTEGRGKEKIAAKVVLKKTMITPETTVRDVLFSLLKVVNEELLKAPSCYQVLPIKEYSPSPKIRAWTLLGFM